MSFKWNRPVREVAQKGVLQIGRGGFLSLAERAKDLMEPYVPMDTGALVRSARAESDETGGRVVYGASYAASVYYGDSISISRDKHPLASAYWDRAAMHAGWR